jgi:hypothetical protein
MVMTIPRNVWRFEILMYLSLLLIVVAGILFDRGEFADTAAGAVWFAGTVLLMIVTWRFIIRLAARKRGFAGLYFAFTGDAKGWFRAPGIG